MIRQAKAGDIALQDRWFRYHMPYALQRLDDKTWLPLNRNYKPLGYLLKAHVEYADYRAQAMRFVTDPRTFKDIWTAANDDILFMYNDGPESREDYFDRLGRLLNHSVQVAAMPEGVLIAPR